MQMVNAVLKDVGRTPNRRRRDPAPVLHGVKRADWRTRPAQARALGAALAQRGEVAYWESPDAVRAAAASRRTRLSSAKLLDAAYRFVRERRICDRSIAGLRLILGRDVGLPKRAAVRINETCGQLAPDRADGAALSVGVHLPGLAVGHLAIRPRCAQGSLLRHSSGGEEAFELG